MLKVKDIMNRNFETVSADTNVTEICCILIDTRISGLPVVDGASRKLVGFVSERDIIASLCKSGFVKREAKDIMTKKVFAVKEDVPVEQISKIFTEHPLRYIPVTKKGVVVGIISRREVINRLLGQYY